MTKKAGFIDTVPYLNALSRVASAYGLFFELDDKCTQPATCLKTGKIFARRPCMSWGREEFMRWLGENYHECGHHAPKCKDALPGMESREIGFNSRLGRMINLIEDWRNEYNDYGRFVGRDQAIAEMQGFYCRRGAKHLAETGKSEDQLMTDVFAWTYTERGVWQPPLELASIEFVKAAGTDISKYSHLRDELWAMETFDDVYNLVIKLFETDDVSEEEVREQAKAAHEAEKGEGEPVPGEGKGEGEGDEDGDGEGSPSITRYEDLIGHKHSGGDSNGEYGEIIYDDSVYSDYKPYQTTETKRTYARKLDSPGRAELDYIRSINKALARGDKLGQKVKRLFQAKTQTQKVYNQKNGRLSKRDLYRVPQGDRDVFTRKSFNISTQDTVLYLLCDASGSMHGNRFTMAGAAAVLMTEAMQPLKVPTKISAFTERTIGWDGEQLEDYIIKDFSEHRSRDNIIDDFNRIGPELHQNADGDSLMIAYRDLKARREHRKILIVLSDGQPCCDRTGDAATFMRKVTGLIQSDPQVELYGIGIETDSVKNFYNDWVAIDHAKDLERALLDVVKSKFL